MEKPNSTSLLHRRRRGEREDKTPIPKNLTWRDTNLRLDLLKKLLETMDLHSLQPPARYRRGREGDQRRWTTGAAAATAAVDNRSCSGGSARAEKKNVLVRNSVVLSTFVPTTLLYLT